MASSRRVVVATGSSRFLFVVALGLLPMACGDDDATDTASTVSVPTSPDGTGTVAPSTTSTGGPTTTDTEQDMDVYFAVEGGFANLIRSMTLSPDGSADVEISGRSSQRELTADAVRAITDELDRSGLFDQDRTYEASGGADRQRYEIGYAGATIVAYDGTVPDELSEAIHLLESALRGT